MDGQHTRSYVDTGLAGIAGRISISPNTITIFALLVMILAAGLVFSGDLTVAGILILLSGTLDLFDGAVACPTGRIPESMLRPEPRSAGDREPAHARPCRRAGRPGLDQDNRFHQLPESWLVVSFLVQWHRLQAPGRCSDTTLQRLLRIEHYCQICYLRSPFGERSCRTTAQTGRKTKRHVAIAQRRCPASTDPF